MIAKRAIRVQIGSAFRGKGRAGRPGTGSDADGLLGGGSVRTARVYHYKLKPS